MDSLPSATQDKYRRSSALTTRSLDTCRPSPVVHSLSLLSLLLWCWSPNWAEKAFGGLILFQSRYQISHHETYVRFIVFRPIVVCRNIESKKRSTWSACADDIHRWWWTFIPQGRHEVVMKSLSILFKRWKSITYLYIPCPYSTSTSWFWDSTMHCSMPSSISP